MKSSFIRICLLIGGIFSVTIIFNANLRDYVENVAIPECNATKMGGQSAIGGVKTSNCSTRTDEISSNTLANLSNYTYLRCNDTCGDDRIFLVIVVPSHPRHRRDRQLLRSVYNRRILGKLCRAVFLLGKVDDETSQIQLDDENVIHRDFVQGNFKDGYRSVTYNHLQGLKWATEYCKQAEYVMKADDDIFVDVYEVMRMLTDRKNNLRDNLLCTEFRNQPVIRNPDSKYYVSVEHYARETFPIYCSGWLIVYSRRSASRIVDEADKVRFHEMSDAFITGSVRQRVKPDIGILDVGKRLTMDPRVLKNWTDCGDSERSLYFMIGPTLGNVDLLKRLHAKTDRLETAEAV